MQSWTRPAIPTLPGKGLVPRIFDSASQTLVEARPHPSTPDLVSIYVCGITPYDATHLGHANTYLAFDTLIRVWLDAGYQVRYVQNVTDIDYPLLERALRDGVDWRELAASQIELFRGDMVELGVIPPDAFVAVTDMIAQVAVAVQKLVENGTGYRVSSPDAAADIYFDSAVELPAWQLGQVSSLGQTDMLQLSAERGGDPLRAGKRHPLDPLLWRAERTGEPAWESTVGSGRPGWHVECTVIALEHLRSPITVNGGGRDLVFPHHEFSAGHAAALTGHPLAGIYAHAGMVAYAGEKMSKSLGNLVLVSKLVAGGVDPRCIRLALLAEHYRGDWEWTDAHRLTAMHRLATWSAWAATAQSFDDGLLSELRELLADDLNTPGAIDAIDAAISGGASASVSVIDAIDALLGIRLGA